MSETQAKLLTVAVVVVAVAMVVIAVFTVLTWREANVQSCLFDPDTPPSVCR